MSAPLDAYTKAPDRARHHAFEWLNSVPQRGVAPTASADQLAMRFARALPDGPSDPAAVVDELAALAEPGLTAMQSGRFFGFVIGGTLPAAMAADWLVSAWDQNAGLRFATPATAAIEEAAAGWLLDLLGLPAGSDVGFTTGATMANFVGLAAGRQHVLLEAGWDLDRDGLCGAPRVRVFVGEERHAVIDLALKYLGLGAPVVVPVDGEGRLRADALAEAMDAYPGPSLVCVQAGNIHSGAFDPLREAVEIAHERGAWVHVDGAFGLWAAVSPRWASELDGLATADSWATDAHKTLNVPYDCGIAVVSRPAAVRSAWACTPATSSGTTTARATRTRKSRNSRAEPAASLCGPRCGHSAGPGRWIWWRAWPTQPSPCSTGCPGSRARWCSTTWRSRRSARASARTSGLGRSRSG